VGLDESVLPSGENSVGVPSMDEVRLGLETPSAPGIHGPKERNPHESCPSLGEKMGCSAGYRFPLLNLWAFAPVKGGRGGVLGVASHRISDRGFGEKPYFCDSNC
jgi:hypothetical protein